MATEDKQLFFKIRDLLKKHDMYYDILPQGNGNFQIIVTNGDWKHDHIRLRNIMKSYGYIFIGRYIPEEEEDSVDDSFSAVYLYSENV